MCIALLSTSHPEYPFILVNNRDEVLTRPTLPAAWWEHPNENVLGGRDLQRPERGTWLAITKQGRIGVLTNFREEGVEVTRDKSRGGIVAAYVEHSAPNDESSRSFARRAIQQFGIHDVGGFNFVFGRLRCPRGGRMPGLSILSNRSKTEDDLTRIATSAGQVHGLSNGLYDDRTWPKVTEGERRLALAIDQHVERAADQEDLIASLFDVLSVNKLPQRGPEEDWMTFARHMRTSIFIPPLYENTEAHVRRSRADPGYGTQKQTVVVVDRRGEVTYVERTLFDENGNRTSHADGQRVFRFEIEGWNED